MVKLLKGIIQPQVEKHEKIVYFIINKPSQSELTNYIKERKNRSVDRSCENRSDSPFVRFIERPDMEKEFIRVNLKERLYKIITE